MYYQRIFRTHILYRFIFKYVRWVHACFIYRTYTLHQPENIPHNEPFIIVANHQNGILDALALLFMISDNRYPVFIARSDIFRNPLMAKLMVFFRLLPAFRIQDIGKNRVSENEKVFSVTTELLAEHNGIIAVFPEGGHQEEHRLGRFKKGFARIAFQAAAHIDYARPIKILPVGLHYHDKTLPGNLSVHIGNPLSTESLHAEYQTHPEKALQILTEQTKEALRTLMLDIQEDTRYAEYATLCEIAALHYTQHKKHSFTDTELSVQQSTVHYLDSLKRDDIHRFNTLMSKTLAFDELRKGLRLPVSVLDSPRYTALNRISFILFYILSIPFQLYALLHQGIPFVVTRLLSRKMDDEFLRVAMDLGLGSLFIFPLWYASLLLFAWFAIRISLPLFIVYAISLPASLWFSFRCFSCSKKVWSALRTQHLERTDNSSFKTLRSYYHEIIKQIVG